MTQIVRASETEHVLPPKRQTTTDASIKQRQINVASASTGIALFCFAFFFFISGEANTQADCLGPSLHRKPVAEPGLYVETSKR